MSSLLLIVTYKYNISKIYSYKMGAGGSSAGAKGELLETMADHEESINCMVISEDGSMLVTGSEDHTARSGFFSFGSSSQGYYI